jgi:hypothetical protein
MLHVSQSRNSVLVLLCALAISAGLEISTARAQGILAEEASPVTTGSAVASAAPAVSAPAPEATAPPAAPEVTTSEVTTLRPVDVHPGKPAETAPDPSRPYFIEFRARAAYNYGHAFVVHGKVGEPITKKSVVGLHPAGESPVPWMIGHIVPVPSETGWSDGDVGYNDKYITAKYRVFLTEAEYRVLLAKMRQMQANTPLWSATVYNCVAFVGDIASFLGMQHPFHWVMPKEYVEGIKRMNGGRQQLPSAWLAAMNPQLAHQQTLHQVAAAHPPGQQQTAPAAKARRAAVAQPPARPQAAESTFAGVQ